MIKRLRTNIILFLLIIAAIYGLLCAYVRLVFIPKIAVPKICEYIYSDTLNPLKISAGEITFRPLKGFLLYDLRIDGPVVLKDNKILRAKVVNVDMAFLPLLWKKIYIRRLYIREADLSVGRDANGEWNFTYLKNLPFFMQKGRFDIGVGSIKMRRCNMVYTDYFKKENSLERSFKNVNVNISRRAGQTYRLTLSCNARERKKEALYAAFDYNRVKKTLAGRANLTTSHIGDYWDYYLDDIFRPWRMACEKANLNTYFSYAGGAWKFDGKYMLDNATLSYGDVSLMIDAVAGHELTYIKGAPKEIESSVKAYLKDVSSSLGKHILLKKGRCSIVIMKNKIDIKDIVGTVCDWPVALNGKFIFGDKRRLSLSGKIADVRHNFCLDLPTYERGSAYWNFRSGNSYLNIKAEIPDLKDALFDLNVKGDIDMPDLSGLLKMNKASLGGAIDFSGNLKGEADETQTLQGRLLVQVRDLSVFGLQPTSFDFNMKVKDGVFDGVTPPALFYNGTVSAAVRMDFKRWGAQFDIENLDLEEFSRLHPNLESTKGFLWSNISCVSDIKDFFGTVKGGGYIKLKDCDLRGTPLFASVHEGIKNINKDLKVPLFERAEMIFSIANRKINLDYAFFEAADMGIHFLGRITFDGKFDITAGTKLLSGTFMAKAMFPPLLAFDALKDVIEIHISGKWPRLKASARVEPMAWFNEFYDFLFKPRPKKYDLEKLWRA